MDNPNLPPQSHATDPLQSAPSAPQQSLPGGTPLQPLPQKKGNKMLTILITIVVLAVVGAAGAAFYFSKSSSEPTLTPTPTPTLEPTPTPDPTADWTAYTTSEYSFQLPHTIKQDPDANIYGPYENAIMITTFTDPETKVPNTDAPFDGFTIYELQLNNTSLDEQIAFDVKQFTDPPRVNPDFKITSREETIGDFNVKIITTEDLNHELYYIKDPARDKVVIFSVLYKTEAFTEIFTQILSTFQFTN
jgi:hypothetical protein